MSQEQQDRKRMEVMETELEVKKTELEIKKLELKTQGGELKIVEERLCRHRFGTLLFVCGLGFLGVYAICTAKFHSNSSNTSLLTITTTTTN